jgi:hypothetical protein
MFAGVKPVRNPVSAGSLQSSRPRGRHWPDIPAEILLDAPALRG